MRDLARRVVELACSEAYEARRQRWRDVNERRKPDRAPVWCRPAGVWQDLLPADSLECTDRLCRKVEYALRQHLYKDWVGDDHIVEPWWGVGGVWECDSEHTWGLRTGHLVASTELGGFQYDRPVRTIEDYGRITVPTFTYSHEKTQDALSRMTDLLGDAMPVRPVCHPPLGAQQGTWLEQLRGMEPMLNDLAFHSELVHRAMAKLTEGALRASRAAEDSGLLTTNHHEPMFCSDSVNGDPGDGAVRLHHLWAAANSQEFQMVSPRMQEEFLLNYQIPVLQQYGAVQYGCCEDLTHKIDIVLRIPNLRVFVCSAWTDLDKVIEACATRHTIMWRQHAARVVLPDDLTPVREHLDQGMRRLRGCYYQVVLRELQTLHGHPDRLREWARVAIAMAEKHA
ncbi:MAG: hypothetical protein JSV65_08775 [Armatimonadota bacterium]|nr:MAG: hypothetical protein JSV65_08775 [Armatimonadota bacterium]